MSDFLYPDRLAHAVTALLIPALPNLFRSESQGGLARELWAKLWPRIERRASAREALEDVARKPEDRRASGALELQLEKILTVDEDLAAEVESLLGAVEIDEIDDLYRELRRLMERSTREPGLEEQIQSLLGCLRSRQREEAARMRKLMESQLLLKPGEGWQALQEARQLLSRHEDPASRHLSSRSQD